MKIPKTEKEFLDALEGALHETNLGKKPWVNTVADALKRRLGLEFKEEEPELPKRASFGIGLNGWKMRPESDEELTDDEALYREAAARYNVLGELRDWLEHHSTEEHATPDAARACGAAVRFLDHSLKDERERLQ